MFSENIHTKVNIFVGFLNYNLLISLQLPNIYLNVAF